MLEVNWFEGEVGKLSSRGTEGITVMDIEGEPNGTAPGDGYAGFVVNSLCLLETGPSQNPTLKDLAGPTFSGVRGGRGGLLG